MTYQEVLENARTVLSKNCKACPVCNGKACGNHIPGPGAKGVGDTAIRNYEKWQDIRVNMNTIHPCVTPDTSLNLFGKTFRYPFFAGPVGAVTVHYSDKYDDMAYNNILVKACADNGIAAFTGDGLNGEVMKVACKAIAASGGGVAAIAGAMIVGGIVAVLVGVFVKKIRRLFPPVITGTVGFTIGLSLYPTAINYMAGGTGNTYESVVAQQGLTEALVYGSWQNWLIAALTLTAVLVLNHKAKGICKLASILIGMLFGYAVALCFGMVSFADVGNAAWFALPEPLHFGLKFDPASCVAIGLLFAINSIQAIGDFTATTVGGLDRDPTDQELQGGIIAYGTSNILTALMGGLPTATYSQNVGIVTTNKVVNRTVFAIAGGFLLLAGISPKFAALLTTIPQCVLGGATVTVFSTIAMTGMKLIASQDLTARNTTIVGLSAALGVGISQASEALSQFPEAFTMVFGQSPVVIATIMAVLLNLILPKEK